MSLNLPSIIFLSETRCSVAEMTKIRYQLGWRNMFVVPCKIITKKGGKGSSRAGGLALLWSDNLSVALNSFSANHIDVIIDNTSISKCWRFTGLYGNPRVVDRHHTWNLIKVLSQKVSLPWLLGGDFNEILSRSEK